MNQPTTEPVKTYQGLLNRINAAPNPKLTIACLLLQMAWAQYTDLDKRCWRMMQALYETQKKEDLGLSFCWYKDGVIVDPATLMQQTGNLVQFEWDNECEGCQIENECPCEGNPHRKGENI